MPVVAALGLLCLIAVALAVALALGRKRLARDMESWRGRHDEQATLAAAAESRLALLDSQRADLEGQVERERGLRTQTETTLTDLRARMEEQQRAAESRFVEIEGKRRQVETRLDGLSGEKAGIETRLGEAERERALLEQRLSALAAEREKEREHLDAQIATLKDGRDAMKKEFRALADELMRTQSEDLRKSASEQLVGIVAPLKENIGKFEGEMRSAREAAVKEQASLKEQLLALTNQSTAVSKEAETLSRALRGDTQKQGAWGELVLTRVLQTAGLEEGREFITQRSLTTEDGRRLRPDVMINLSEDKQLVIDSKVSLTDYDQAVNSVDEAERSEALSRHVASLQKHIKELSGKEYDALANGSGDYVIMFVPIEGALSEALRARTDLTEFALERHVMIATPTTLMMALRTIKNVWDVERRTRNAEAIAERAGTIYNKVAECVRDFEEVGKHMDKAKAVYDKSFARLSTGQGNVVRQIEMLRELGAKTKKNLPQTLVIEADDNASSSSSE